MFIEAKQYCLPRRLMLLKLLNHNFKQNLLYSNCLVNPGSCKLPMNSASRENRSTEICLFMCPLLGEIFTFVAYQRQLTNANIIYFTRDFD